jgi:hypothetical protein
MAANARNQWHETLAYGGGESKEDQKRIKRGSEENHGDQRARELLCAELSKNCDK